MFIPITIIKRKVTWFCNFWWTITGLRTFWISCKWFQIDWCFLPTRFKLLFLFLLATLKKLLVDCLIIVIKFNSPVFFYLGRTHLVRSCKFMNVTDHWLLRCLWIMNTIYDLTPSMENIFDPIDEILAARLTILQTHQSSAREMIDRATLTCAHDSWIYLIGGLLITWARLVAKPVYVIGSDRAHILNCLSFVLPF